MSRVKPMSFRTLLVCLGTLSFMTCVECSRQQEGDTPAKKPEAAVPSTAGSTGAVGTITGTVTYTGTATVSTYTPNKDTQVCGTGAHTGEDVVIGLNKGLKYVVVSLIDITKSAPPDVSKPVVLDQKGCWFRPHVLLVPVGTTLEILNNDDILHNIHTTSTKNPPMNKAQPKFMKKITHTFTAAPEVIRVSCDVHHWMNGWIIVQDHLYYAITDDNGQFTLPNVPAGTYTIQYWHEKFGQKTAKVTVTAEETITADLAY